MEVKKEVEQLIKKALKTLSIEDQNFLVEWPKDIENGDISTNIALVLAGRLKKHPGKIAKNIIAKIEKKDIFTKIEVADRGFINFFLSNKYFQNQIAGIISDEKNFGSLSIGKGKKVSVEYVSANPTGPLHMGNARGGPIGDVLANVFKKAGYSVEREYLHNDVGGQVKELGKSIYFNLKPKEKENEQIYYQGEYIQELAVKVAQKINIDKLSKDDFIKQAGEIAVEVMLCDILNDTKAMGINFDTIKKESNLKKEALKVIDELKDKNVIKEKDKALWFAPSDEFLKDRETVVRKSDGEYTYFASDIVYHKEKFEKGNDLVIDVWGSNHYGHVSRMKASIKALGFNPDNFKAILYQFVRIKRGDSVLKMSKRAGNFITAKEILDEVGKDAFRFFMLMHKSETHIDFDLELARKKQNDNPIFYVQYAHSRICSIFKKAPKLELSSIDYSLLTSNEEINLIRHLLKFPEIIEEITKTFAVNVLTAYAIDIASLFHHFYEKHTVISENKELTKARLALLKATKITLVNTLDLLGVSAPLEM